MISTSLSKISFPLFKPKFILRSLVVFGLLYVNYGIYSYLVDSKNEKIVKQKIAFIKRLFNNKEITDIIPLNEAINVGKRALSSVPSGSLKLFPVGTTVKTKIKRFNSDTGEIVFNHTNTLKIRKWTENNMMYAHLYNGKTKTWSSQQLNGNPFLPPARWYRKKGFNFKNIVTEESEKFYPINKGRKIGFKFRTISRGGLTAENVRDCEVKDIAEVVILGVKQKLFQTECVTRKNQTTEMATYFYSSQYDYILKSKIIINSPEGKFEENSEVISLDIPKL